MTKRKRKSPEKKPVRKEPGRLSRSSAYIGGVIARHPTAVGGSLAFAERWTEDVGLTFLCAGGHLVGPPS